MDGRRYLWQFAARRIQQLFAKNFPFASHWKIARTQQTFETRLGSRYLQILCGSGIWRPRTFQDMTTWRGCELQHFLSTNHPKLFSFWVFHNGMKEGDLDVPVAHLRSGHGTLFMILRSNWKLRTRELKWYIDQTSKPSASPSMGAYTAQCTLSVRRRRKLVARQADAFNQIFVIICKVTE